MRTEQKYLINGKRFQAKYTVNKTNGANLGFEEKMQRLTGELKEQFLKSSQLEEAIHDNIRRLGYDV